MKKIFTIALMSVITLGTVSTVTSCSKDDDEVVAAKYDVVGTWDLVKYKDTDGTFQDMTILKYWVKFNSDKSYSSFYLGDNFSGTYNYDNNDKIEVTVQGEKLYYKINSLTGNEAEAEMYSQDNPADKIVFKLKRK
ncbi:hypothetical protein [Epilithonimonas tenax]|uniref:hypothetical protein n=1 Tax=Epilithonimonas tenax TaxID=191577 RepID=UPI00048179AB|nr:hypothetical protein [Epilithonimonas tenax]